MPDKIYMYGDQDTISVLNKDIPKVILIGGYLGYNNFGDILQLKEAIAFHKSVTTLEPVVICQVSSIPDKHFLSRLRSWFGVCAIIFIQDHAVDVALLNLHLIDNVFSMENLHLYGGGFLNKYWGGYFLKLVEGLIRNFSVDNYIISGQQIGAEFANTLKAHFEKYRPKLIGVRDFESQKIINSIGFKCEFSFDDASNIIENWARRKPVNCRTAEALLIHLNTSLYTWNKREEQREELNRVSQTLKTLAARFKTFEPVFLSAYSEYRISVRDTLATIISLEAELPYLDYRVMDIAHMALLHDPSSITIDNNLAIFSGGVAVSSSYHTALFCNMLGIPCYMLSDNAYYKQKREGLGENRSLDQFLENPSVLSYTRFMEQRANWLEKLSLFFENVERDPVRQTISFRYTKSELKPAPFRFKEASVVENKSFSLQNALAKISAAIKKEFGVSSI